MPNVSKITVTGEGSIDYCYIMIDNGIEIISDAEYVDPICSTITFFVGGDGPASPGTVTIDGEVIYKCTTDSWMAEPYVWTVPDDVAEINIDLECQWQSGIITVTTVKAAPPEPEKTHRTLIEGVGFSVSAGRCLVSGVGYSIQKGRTLIDGVGYDVAFGGGGIGSLEVGTSVFANVSGVRTEFLVVHQGNPNPSLYDASCDGTWLLQKSCYYNHYWRSGGGNVYPYSNANTHLNNTYLNSLDTNVSAAIKDVVIPYKNGGSGDLRTGANGYATKVFLLAGHEVNMTNAKMSADGACLDYFSGTSTTANDEKRIANYSANGVAIRWWLRTPYNSFDGEVCCISNRGGLEHISSSGYMGGYRAAFILDSSTAIDPNTFDILG